jgi:DNA primase
MRNLKGSEKQIKWANDILNRMNIANEVWKESIEKANYKKEETRQKAREQVAALIEELNSNDNSSDIINKYSHNTKCLEHTILYMYDLAREKAQRENTDLSLSKTASYIDKNIEELVEKYS